MDHIPPDRPVSPELLLLLLADTRLPVAGHTQSGGLEPAVASGLRASSVPEYLAVRLASITRVEAATAVVALRLLILAGTDLTTHLAGIETAWAARTPSPAMRANSRVQARALLRTVRRLWPIHPAVALVDHPGVPRAVVLAGAAAAGGLSGIQLARLVGYDDVQTICAAALKLLPLDPALATHWAHQALPLVEDLAIEVSGLKAPEDIPVAGAPQLEAWAESHAVARRRLFSA